MKAYYILQGILIASCALSLLYLLPFAIAGLFYKQRGLSRKGPRKRMTVLIPGYKEDEVILGTANAALKQDYPTELYDVVIIADSFQQETLRKLRELPLQVVEVSFEKSTKAKALNACMARIADHYDIAVILDADNIMAPDFLDKMDMAFTDGVVAVQGHRVAKNFNNSMAVLDAVSEEVNNHIFRKGHRVLGYSSAIIGSGMAFRYAFFKGMMKDVQAVGGFDKEIELRMLQDGHRIEYVEDAIVYDEKVQDRGGFQNQRRRWLSAQFHYFRKDILGATRDLVTKGNRDYFDKAIQFIQPPRVVLLAMVLVMGTVFTALNLLFSAGMGWTLSWIILALACVVTLAISIPRTLYNMRTVRAAAALPAATFSMLVSLTKLRGANKTFIHTRHFSNSGNTI